MVAEGNTGGESSEAKGSVNKGLKGAEDTSGTISTATQSRPSLIPDQVKEKTQAAAVSDGNLKFLTVTDMSSIGDGQRRKANSERQSLSSQEDLFLNLANTDTKPMKAADTTDNRRVSPKLQVSISVKSCISVYPVNVDEHLSGCFGGVNLYEAHLISTD